MKPPSYHTERNTQFDVNPYAPGSFYYPGPNHNQRARHMPSAATTTTHQNSFPQDTFNPQHSDTYIPSYQKNVHINPNVEVQYFNPTNLVHRQFNSPISLYSNDNIQEVMSNHVNRVK